MQKLKNFFRKIFLEKNEIIFYLFIFNFKNKIYKIFKQKFFLLAISFFCVLSTYHTTVLPRKLGAHFMIIFETKI